MLFGWPAVLAAASLMVAVAAAQQWGHSPGVQIDKTIDPPPPPHIVHAWSVFIPSTTPEKCGKHRIYRIWSNGVLDAIECDGPKLSDCLEWVSLL